VEEVQLSQAKNEEIARWYVIHAHPKQEDRVVSNLNVLRVQVFCPKIKERRFQQFASEPIYLIKPIFPRYIFARFELEKLCHKIRYTRGVCNIVSFGDGPVSIEEEIITLIQSNIREDGFARIDPSIKVGDKVIVKDGPLKDFAGIFEQEMKDADRIRILLETVSYQAHLEVERCFVKKGLGREFGESSGRGYKPVE
jgi:transcriptional antiterminator RfaH